MKWTDILKQAYTDQEIEDFLDNISEYMERLTAQMFEDGYDDSILGFDYFDISITETSRTDNYDGLVFEYDYFYDSPYTSDRLNFALVKISGTEDRKVDDVFFDTEESRNGFKYYSKKFMQQPNIRQVMERFEKDLFGLMNRVKR